jgi:hypothetical protein
MAIQITIAEDGNLLTVEHNDTSIPKVTDYSIQKEDCSLQRGGASKFTIYQSGEAAITFMFADVVSPVVADADALEVQIETWIKNVVGPTPAGTTDVNITEVGGNAVTTAVPVSLPSGTETPTSSIVTDSTGSPVAAGKTGVTFTPSAAFVGTINGVARSANFAYTFTPLNPGKTLAAIPYTVTAGNLTIDTTA